MIKTIGTYYLSKDGGKTFKEYGNMLVQGYYIESGTSNLKVTITSNGTPPTKQDSSVSSGIDAYVSNGFTNFSIDIEQDMYKINCSVTFDIGLGNTIVARDINILSGGTLFSRALFKDDDGNPIDIDIDVKDNIVVKYVLSYYLPRQDIPVTIGMQNKTVNGILKVCNPNVWGTSIIGYPVDIKMVGVAPSSTWNQDLNGYIDSGITDHTLSTSPSSSFSNTIKKYIFSSTANLDKLNTTFRQIAFSVGAFSPRNIAILINLDEDVVNTPDDFLSLGIEINQRIAP